MKLKREKKPKAPDLGKKRVGEKVSAIKTDRLMKVGRILLWVVILFLVVKGIAGLMQPDSRLWTEQKIKDYQADADLRERAQVKAAAFAEAFAYEYYTFSGEYNDDYEKRVKRYTTKNLDIKAPMSEGSRTEVALCTAEEIHYLSGKEMDVDVHLQVVYEPTADGAQKKDIYIRVPIAADKLGTYAVTSLPLYIPQTKAGSESGVDTYTGNSVEAVRVQQIKETLNSFLSVYFGGTDNEVAYYLTADSTLKRAAGGMVTYEKLDYATVSMDEEMQEYLVDVKFTVIDNGRRVSQRAYIRMKYVKTHYYVKSMNTRPI